MQRYVYGIIQAQDVLEFDVQGIGDGAPRPQSFPLGEGLAMVSTPYRGEAIRPSRRNMITHTKVLEAIMAQQDVLPMRFGTVLPAAADGETILRAHKQQFVDAFGKVGGCRELSLKIYWQGSTAFDEVMAADEDLRAARDSLAERDPKQSHYERIEFGKQVEAAIAAKRDKEAREMRLRLQHLCTEFSQGPISDDMMVANFAFLVTPDQEAAIDEALALLDQVHGARVRFRYVGPMPPFSFVELNIDPSAAPLEGV
ncbi:MAG: GvpL/GvpF family gas vesicle protein [Pseudomonadota bacterium]